MKKFKEYLQDGLELEAEIKGIKITRRYLKLSLAQAIIAVVVDLSISIITFLVGIRTQDKQFIGVGIFFASAAIVGIIWTVLAILRLKLIQLQE